jgi:hypothetical protein
VQTPIPAPHCDAAAVARKSGCVAVSPRPPAGRTDHSSRTPDRKVGSRTRCNGSGRCGGFAGAAARS